MTQGMAVLKLGQSHQGSPALVCTLQRHLENEMNSYSSKPVPHDDLLFNRDRNENLLCLERVVNRGDQLWLNVAQKSTDGRSSLRLSGPDEYLQARLLGFLYQ